MRLCAFVCVCFVFLCLSVWFVCICASLACALHAFFLRTLFFLCTNTKNKAKNKCFEKVKNLQEIHKCGIIHGDLKPSNILLFPKINKKETNSKDETNAKNRQRSVSAGGQTLFQSYGDQLLSQSNDGSSSLSQQSQMQQQTTTTQANMSSQSQQPPSQQQTPPQIAQPTIVDCFDIVIIDFGHSIYGLRHTHPAHQFISQYSDVFKKNMLRNYWKHGRNDKNQNISNKFGDDSEEKERAYRFCFINILYMCLYFFCVCVYFVCCLFFA